MLTGRWAPSGRPGFDSRRLHRIRLLPARAARSPPPARLPYHGRDYVAETANEGAPSWLTARERRQIEGEKRRARHEALGLHSARHPWTRFQRPDYRVIERAYRHDDSRFRARLLGRTWLVERDVVHMASLRPSTEAMLLAIALSDRWFFHEAVRDALCNNPFPRPGSWARCSPPLATPPGAPSNVTPTHSFAPSPTCGSSVRPTTPDAQSVNVATAGSKLPSSTPKSTTARSMSHRTPRSTSAQACRELSRVDSGNTSSSRGRSATDE